MGWAEALLVLLQRLSSPLQAVGSPSKLQRLGSLSSDIPSYATLQRRPSPKQSPIRLAKSYRSASPRPPTPAPRP